MPHDDLENLLRQLPLEKPSAKLDQRVFGAVAQQDPPTTTDPIAQTVRRLRIGIWVGLGAPMAALLAITAIVALYNPNATTTQSPSDPPDTGAAFAFDPVRIEYTTSSLAPGGVVMVDDQTPAAGFIEQTVEHVKLIDEEQNVRMEFTYPRQDVVLVPLDVQ